MTSRRKGPALAIALTLLSAAPPGPAAATQAAPAPDPAPDGLAQRDRPVSRMWTAAGVLLGVGAVATVAGIVKGLAAWDGAQEGSEDCGEPPYDYTCGPEGLALRRQARRDAYLATASLVGGLTALGLGALSASMASGSWAAITTPLPGGGAVVVEGRF